MSPTGDLLVALIFALGSSALELAQSVSLVALALHLARSSKPQGVTQSVKGTWQGIASHAKDHLPWGHTNPPNHRKWSLLANWVSKLLGTCPCTSILAEGAIALSVTLSGGALFAS